MTHAPQISTEKKAPGFPGRLFAGQCTEENTEQNTAKSLPAAEVKDLSLWYGKAQALHRISLPIPPRKVTALIGPSGCGKSTLLRCFNRMNELLENVSLEGEVLIHGQEIHSPTIHVTQLRRKVGMVFQKSNPFPKSIFDNIAFGPKLHGTKCKSELSDRVEESLRSVGLWNEVADRLHHSALELSGGQQQRLCIARAIAVQPEILLMDEPCSALDPGATAKVEQLIHQLKRDYTIIIVTHNMQQAQRVSDHTAFLLSGELIEHSPTHHLFESSTDTRTRDYIQGRFG